MPPSGGGGGGQGVLPYIGNTDMCCWRGYGFQAIWSGKEYGFQVIWSGIGSSNHKKNWSSIGSRLTGSLTRLKSRTIDHFWSGIGSQNLKNLV